MLEKILEEIDKQKRICLEIDNGYEFNAGALDMANSIKDIIRKHMNDGWIPCEERLPTKEECEECKKGNLLFWITYGSSGNYSTKIAKCEWVEASNADGSECDYAEFWVDQAPSIFYPSTNLIQAWKIAHIPEPYRPEKGAENEEKTD